MNRFRIPFFVLIIAIIISAACGEKEPEQKTFDLSLEVARMNEEVFTLADLNKTIDAKGWRESTSLNRVKDTVQYNFDALQDMLINSIIEERAENFSIDTIPAAQRRLREFTRRLALTGMWDDIVKDAPEITPEDVDTFYENNKKLFFTPAGVELAQILISTNPADYLEEGESHSKISKDSINVLAMDLMQEVVDKLEDGADFGNLAKEYSHDRQSGSHGGYLGWIEQGQTPPAFDSIAFSLSPGDISPAFKTRYGYHVIRIFNYRDSSYLELDDQLYERLGNGLESKARTDYANSFLDSLREESELKYNEPLLKKELSSFKPGDWVAIIDKYDTVFSYEFTEAAMNYQMVNRLPDLKPEDKKKAMERTLNHHVLAAEAHKLGYFESENIEKKGREYESQLRKQHYRWTHQPEEYSPTDEEVKAYYDAHRDEYYSEKPLKVKHILFQDSLKAEEIRKKIEDGADFDEMAMKYYPGDEDVRKSLYDLGYISSDEMPIKFYNSAWILDVGDVSRPIKTEYGYHIIKLEDRKPVREFEGIKHIIRGKIVEAKNDSLKQAWLDDLFAGKTVDVDSALVREFVYQEVPDLPDTTAEIDTLESAIEDSMATEDSLSGEVGMDTGE